jgi:hemin transport system permease protein
MGAVNLAIVQLRRAPVRTGLLVAVVAVLLFLVEYLAAVSSSLQALNTGALRHLRADAIIYNASSDDSLDASRVPAGVVSAAGRVSGVAGAQALGVADFTVTGPGGRYELDLIGLSGGGPGWPHPASGSLPGGGQALADASEVPAGLGIGRRIVLEPGGVSLRVTGAAAGVRYDGLVTAWTTFGSWARAVRAANPGGTVVPNAVAVQGRPGVPAAMLARRLAAALPGSTVLTRAAAVADVPGASVLAATFGLLIAFAFAAAVLVISSVFLLVTVQRWRIWVLARGLGASAGRLGLVVMAQAVLVVAAACVVASAALAVVAEASGPGFPVRAAPGLVAATAAAALTGALVSCLLPARRIGRLDPAAAVVRA